MTTFLYRNLSPKLTMLIARLIFISILTLNTVAAETSSTQISPVLGEHYLKLDNTPQTTPVEQNQLTFYFWPGSESSYQLELALQQWLPQHKGVIIKRIPLVKRPSWRLLAKAWLSAEKLQLGEDFLNALYRSLHIDKQAINTRQQLVKFIDQQDINHLDFMIIFNSLEINQKLKSLENSAAALPISGVPTIIINETWLTDAEKAKTSGQILNVIEQLLLH